MFCALNSFNIFSSYFLWTKSLTNDFYQQFHGQLWCFKKGRRQISIACVDRRQHFQLSIITSRIENFAISKYVILSPSSLFKKSGLAVKLVKTVRSLFFNWHFRIRQMVWRWAETDNYNVSHIIFVRHLKNVPEHLPN